MTDLLGNDDIDFERAASAFPDISLDGEGDIPSFPTSQALPTVTGTGDLGFDLGDFSSAPAREVKVTGDEEDEAIEKFESEFPDIGGPEEHISPPSQPTFGALPPFAPRPQQSALSSTPILTQQIDEEEPEVIREWRERQAEEIRKRDEASKARRQETISKAERAIDQFYEDYTSKRERTIRENKEQEATYVASLTDALSQGTTWNRICDLVELNNSQSKTLARSGTGTTELTRFKEVLLRLRREGDSAPGAGGY